MVVFISFREVKANVRIEQLISYLGIEMHKEGKHYRGACPFCLSKDNRALYFDVDKDLWYCHGKCRVGGDVISFVAYFEQIGTRDAAQRLYRDFHIGSV